MTASRHVQGPARTAGDAAEAEVAATCRCAETGAEAAVGLRGTTAAGAPAAGAARTARWIPPSPFGTEAQAITGKTTIS